ncbi:MAG TPA: NAD-dependent protein deacylase [Candidatus Scatovivens faecipullorum]|nr:NAD-dependent protein deacylase [Candidatus Scatovivens faecipullorum]
MKNVEEKEIQDKINQFKIIIQNSKNIVFFGGAGVSTESGIPDFRSKDGLYNQKYKYPPEMILSHTFFKNNTEEFYKFYKEKMNSLNFNPNITHVKLAELEKEGKLKAVITQNIDGLHQKAGSKNVLELHGSILRNYCIKCKKFYSAEFVFSSKGVPKCECGGIIKPDVVLYEENLNENILNSAIQAIQNAEVLIVAGTSLTVYPASGLVNFFKGKNLILINKTQTSYDNIADIIINSSLGEVFKEL